MNKLGFDEQTVMEMTPRKFFRIFDEYQFMNGIKKPEQGIDDLP